MLTDYIRAAMHHATYEILEDDGTFFGRIPGFQGVWANEPTLEACRDELQSVLEDWILFRLSDGLDLPIVAGFDPTPSSANLPDAAIRSDQATRTRSDAAPLGLRWSVPAWQPRDHATC